MNHNKQQVAVWGFPEEALQGWPNDLDPIPIEKLPTESLIFVHSDKAEAFQQESLTFTDDQLQEAVLYHANGSSEEPDDAWMYFGATVKGGDWSALRQLLACPQQFAFAEWAEEVPIEQIEQTMTMLAEGKIPKVFSVPLDIWQELANHAACRQAFCKVLQERRKWHYRFICPPIKSLDAYVLGQNVPWLEAHLVDCPFCQAKVATIKKFLPVPKPVEKSWLEVILEQGTEALGTLIKSLQNNQMKPVLAGSSRRALLGKASTSEQASLTQVLQKDKGSIKLKRTEPERQLIVRWSKANNTVRFEKLRQESLTPFKKFRLEIRQDKTPLLSRTANQKGQVEMSLTELAEALSQDNTTLVILPNAQEEQ